MMHSRWTKIFIYSAGAILLAAAMERFLLAAGDAQAMILPEPMFGIPLRYAVLLIGVLESIVALICLFGKRTGLQLGWLAWLLTQYLIYWIVLLTKHFSSQATCIGSLTDPLGIWRGMPGIIIGLLPFCLFLGSYVELGWLWRETRRAKGAKYSKMSCPACGVHLRFDNRNVGQKIACPHCHAALTLRRSENLKMPCFFCSEHIEFPPHAIGDKISCPHCKMDITLKEPT